MDIMIGVARRSWARNEPSIETCIEYNKEYKHSDHITLPYIANQDMVKNLVEEYYKSLIKQATKERSNRWIK